MCLAMQYSFNKNFERGDKIQPFYNRFSYPLAESNSNVNGAKLFKILDREMQSKGFKGKTFLDVGCGSGHRILDVAKAFPEAKFYAFDISEKSIDLARQQAVQDGVELLRLTRATLWITRRIGCLM